MQQNERKASRTRSPRGRTPVVECFDALARITSKELASTRSVKSGTLRSALMQIVKLMNNLVKSPKKNDDKSAVAMLKKNDWHENVWQPVVKLDKNHERSGRPDKNRDTDHELKRGPTGRRSSNARQFGLCLSRHEPAEVHSAEELRHAETNPTCEIHESYCTSH